MHHRIDESDLTPFEAQLAGLIPAAGLDRDRLMFLAGQAAWQPKRAFGRLAWPICTAVLVGLCAALVLLRPTVSESQIVYVVQPAEKATQKKRLDATGAEPAALGSTRHIERTPIAGPQGAAWHEAASHGYLGVRNLVLARGANAWHEFPRGNSPSGSPVAYLQLMRDAAHLGGPGSRATVRFPEP